MSDFIILTDSVSDMDKATREKYGVEYVAMNYIVDDKEYRASLDWESHSVKDFYDLMRNGKRVLTTQVPQNVYSECFESILKSGKDGVYIACSSALSSSVNTARVVANELCDKYPDNRIYCVDSLISSLGQGALTMLASALRDEGKSAEQTAKHIEDVRLNVNQFGTAATLEYMRRAGRVKASKAFFGNLFGVRPIIISDARGQNYGYKKAKGTTNARRLIAEEIKNAADGVYENLYITHSDCIDDAVALRDEILKIAPFKNVQTGVIGPIVGATVGPGTIIAFCFGKQVTIEGNE